MNRQERRRQKKLAEHKGPGKDPSPELRARNLAAFTDFLPGLAHELTAHKPQGRLIDVEDGDHDIEFDEIRLYGGQGARSFARNQLDAYWRQPKRITVGPIDSNTLDAHSNLFGTQLVTRAVDSGLTFKVNFVTEQSYFLVVLGVGLAPHIAELAEKIGCQYLILVETDLEGLYHSTSVFDWRPLLAEFSGNKKLEIVVSNSAVDISNIVQRAVLNANPCGLEGMYWFDHLQNEIFAGAFTDFLECRLPDQVKLAGFFTDEFYMISQTYENLRHGTARMVASAYAESLAPAFIVGAGPSLDMSMGVLKENEENAVIIACGTALEPLMMNGIQPDFLIHLERDEINLDNHRIFRQDYDFSDTCLIAATNLFPGTSDFHDDTIFFFRPGISCRPLFARTAEQGLSRSDPLAANSALAFAHRAGFRNIYFIGVDMGAKDPEYHHSKESAYSTRGVKSPYQFSIPAEGNFGGTVIADPFLTRSRQWVELSIMECGPGHRHYNCSDGALIAGAEPLDPSTLSLPELDGKQDLVKRIIESSPIYEKEEFDRAWQEADLARRIPAFSDRLKTWVNGFDPTDPASTAPFIELSKFPGIEDTVAMIFRGSLFYCLSAVAYFAPRVATDAERDTFRTIVREELSSIIDHIERDAVGLAAALEAGEQPQLTIEQP